MSCSKKDNILLSITGLDNPFNDTPLMLAIRNNMCDIALQIIDEYDIKCKPGYINKNGSTALILACQYKMNAVALSLIDRFGKLCKPEQFNRYGRTALLYTCIYNIKDIAIKLIDTFGEKNNVDLGVHGLTSFMFSSLNKMNNVSYKLANYISKYEDISFLYACRYGMNEAALKLIDRFGEKVKPICNYNRFGSTNLILACKNSMNEVSLKIIDIFGKNVKPGYIDLDGMTALMISREKKMDEVSLQLIDKFGKKNFPTKCCIIS